MARIAWLGAFIASGVWDLAAQPLPPPPPPPPPPGVVASDGVVVFSGRDFVGGRGGPGRPAAPTGDGVIEGTVVNALTGAPVRRARVMLFSDETGVSKQTTAAAGGAFRFDQLPEGHFHLTVYREGQSNAGPGMPPVRLAKAEKKTGLVLKLQPGAVLTGKVVDEEGEPMVGIQVNVQRRVFNGRQVQTHTQHSAATDDRGEYRIHGVQPGRYRLSAGLLGSEYSTSYYPDARDPAAAQFVRLSAGAEVRADFRLEPAPVERKLDVRGRVVGLPDVQNQSLNVIATPIDQTEFVPAGVEWLAGEPGSFVIRGLTPGRYNLVAQLFSQLQDPPRIGVQAVDLTGDSVDNVVIELGQGVELTGRIRMDGSAGQMSKPHVMLIPAGTDFMMMPPQPAVVAEDGSFRLQGVPSGTWDVMVRGMIPGAYVKSVKLGEADVLGKGMVIGNAAPGALEILVSGKGAVIEGVIAGAAEDGFQYHLKAWPEADTLLPRWEDIAAMAEPNGKFRLSGLRPGSYRIVAVPRHEAGRLNDPDLLKDLEKLMTVVKVDEGGRITQDIKAVTKADLDQIEGLN